MDNIIKFPRLFFIFFLLVLITSAIAQNITELKFDRITTEKIIIEKGLSQNTVNCIFQDSYGFMWFGTWDGLNKYDGYDFLILNNERGLSHNTIWSIVEDDKGLIWVATEDGLNRLNPEKKEIHVFRNSVQPGHNGNNFINHLLFDSDKKLWLATCDGLYIYDDQAGSFSGVDLQTKDQDSHWINFLYQDLAGNIWAATRHGLFLISHTSGEVHGFYHSSGNTNTLSDNIILSLIQARDGKYWIGTQNGLDIMNLSDTVFTRGYQFSDPLSSNVIKVLFEDKDQNVWIGTDNQLNIYDRKSGSIIRYESLSNTTSLINNDIRSIYADRTGTIWLGTYKGINKVDFTPCRFTHFAHIPEDQNSLSDDIIYAITEDRNGLVWIGSYKGVNILDRKTGKFSYLKHEPQNPNSLSSDRIKSILIDSNNDVWIGTEDAGLNFLNRSTGIITRLPVDPNLPASVSNPNIQCLMEDDQKRLWIGTNLGIDILDIRNGAIRKLKKNGDEDSGLSSNKVWTITMDRNRLIWVGTDGGIDLFDSTLKKIRSYRHDPSDPESLSGDRVFCILHCEDGLYWIGTIGAGLNRFDPATGKFRNYQEKQGLPNNVVYGILEDSDGNLWISTNRGLSKFDKSTESFINYTASDGLQGNEFNSNSYFKNNRGEMYFGGMNGFNVFHPDNIMMNKNVPRVVVTSFEVFNEPVKRRINDQDTILLKHSDNYFAFTFSALDYTNPSKNQYKYRLEGYDEDWNTTSSTNRRAEYKKVPPGTYWFQVIGSNNDGIWNIAGTRVKLVIKPAWWKTNMFIIIIVLFGITVFSLIIYRRFINLEKKHSIEKKVLEYEKRVFELEQMALRLQMNPHFIFNSLNAIQSFVVSFDTDRAISYLAKFSHLMRMILANSGESFVPLRDEIKALSYYMDLEKLRFDNKFEYNLVIDPRIDQEFIEIPPMILQPYVENAIIHGLVNNDKNGKLDITFKLNDKTLLCVIEDDGIGREKARELREQSGIKRKSRGMMITKERLEMMNKQTKDSFGAKIIDLKDENGNAAGTRVEVCIRYHEA